jgi:hypothetical protein
MRNNFDAGSIHYEGKWEGARALEIETSGPECHLGPGSGAFLTPGSGAGIRAGNKSRHDLGSGMNIQDLIFENLLSVFRVKILKFFNENPDPGTCQP